MAPGVGLDRNRPACCGAVEDFVAARHRAAHQRKLTRARSLINNDWSVREEQRLKASKRNVKNDQMQDDRFANIERENMRLLLRMQEIGQRDGERRKDLAGTGNEACKAAARIALGAPEMVGPTKNISRRCSVPAMGRGSNNDARMRELRRIDTENQKLLKRLQGTRSTVSNKKNEEAHQAQQRVMRMRQEHGPKMPASRIPLPFSAIPEPSMDPDCDRIQELHAALQLRVEELEKMDEVAISEDGASPVAAPQSGRSTGSDAAAPEPSKDVDTSDRREYVGGTLPEHSRLLVEKLMEEVEELERPAVREAEHATDTAPEEEDDKDAVVRMLAAAEGLDALPRDLEPIATAADYLSYDNVVQRSRAALQAASLSQAASASRQLR